MKNFKIKTWIFILSMFQTTIIFAQSNTNFVPDLENAYYFTPQNVGFSTPQTAEFTQYGNLNINHYNGLLDLEIPLYEYKDNDFDIPISLKYISAGFKPSKRPSLVGYNWLLNVGGVITREVYGSPDDAEGFYAKPDPDRKYMPDGILAAARKANQTIYNNNQLWNFQMTKTTNNNPYIYGDFVRDFAHDIFHFNFGKYKGSFIIDGTIPVLLSGKECRINISNMTTQAYSTTNVPSTSQITITTPDGFIYEFGGNTSYLEYFIPNNPDKIKKKPVYIISWYLKSITATNGRMLSFFYTSKEQKNKYDYLMRNSISSNISISRSSGQFSYMAGPGKLDLATIKINDRVFVPLLDKIEVGKVTIEFNRNIFNSSFYSTETASDLYFLNTIKLKYDNTQLIKDIAFSYKVKERYFFLDTLKLNNHAANKQVYKFDYNLDSTLPNPQTISVDHWGFWNGGYSMEENVESYLLNIENRKTVNTSVFNTGLLKKITYPAGGTTEIEYEYNRCRYYKERNTQTIHLQNITSSTDIPCGGARVKLIKDYDPVNNKITNERSFQYKNPDNSAESGIIATVPKYKTYDKIGTLEDYTETAWNNGTLTTIFCTKNVETVYHTMSSNTIGNENNISEYHVGYQDVIEKFKDNSYIHYHFSSLLDVPDDESVNTHYQEPYNTGPARIVDRILTNAAFAEKFGLYRINDMSKYRGKLLKKATFSSSNEKVEEEIYTYNLSEAKDTYKVTVTSLPAGQVANKIYTIPCLLVQKEITDKNNIQEQVVYSYNSNNLLSSKTITNSNGLVHRQEMKYPFDFQTSPYPAMVTKNILSPVIETYNYKSNSLIEKATQDYALQHNTFYAPVNSKYQKGPYGSLEVRETYQYDTKGNVREVIKNGFDKTVYLWGYNYQYPIAKIENATYAEVETAAKNVFSVSSMDVLSAQTTPNETKLQDGSLQNALPNALVTTYTYKPLTGIKTATDPRKVKTTYEYDAFGRLQTVKDPAGNIIESYNYHYKNP